MQKLTAGLFLNKYTILLWAINSLVAIIAKASDDVLLIDSVKAYPITQMSVLRQAETITIDSVVKQPQLFHLETKAPAFGMTTETIWVRLTISNKSANKDWYLEIDPLYTYSIDVYEIKG